MTDPLAGLRSLAGRDPLAGLRALAGPGPWEPTASPLIQRRRMPDGSYETRPTPRPGEEPAITPAVEKSFGESASDLANRAITASAEGLAALPEILLARREHGTTGKVVVPDVYGALTPDAIEGEGGFFDVKTGREDIRRQYEERQDEFRKANLPPPLTASLDTLAEALGPAEAIGVARMGLKGVGRGAAHLLDPTRGIEASVGKELAELAPTPRPERRANLPLRKAVEEKLPLVRNMTDDELRLLMDSAPDEATERAIERTVWLRAKGSHAGPPALAPQVPPQNLRRAGEGLQSIPDKPLALVPEVLPPERFSHTEWGPEHVAPPGYEVRRSGLGVHVTAPGGRERIFRGPTAEAEATAWLDRTNEQLDSDYLRNEDWRADDATAVPAEPDPEFRSYGAEYTDELREEWLRKFLSKRGVSGKHIPLDALPEPHTMPRADFEKLSPLPPETTAQLHRIGVEQAVESGASVRPEILADYPDLSADVYVARLYHGSPNTSLDTISARPPARQFDNGGSVFGAFFSPDKSDAARYTGGEGRVYEAELRLKKPKVMSFKEYDDFLDFTRRRDEDGFRKSLPPEQWETRKAELKMEAERLRGAWESEGYDGILIRNSRGQTIEVASFRDVPVREKPPLSGPSAAPTVNAEAGFVKLPTGPGFMSRFFRKDGQFAALGAQRGWAFERANDMSAEIAAGQRKITDTLRDWSSAFEDDVVRAGHGNPSEVLDYITEGLEGGNDLSGVSPKLRAASLAMREHIDLLSDGYQQYADLPTALRETIEQNKGRYLPRVFEAFENPDWKAIVDPTSPKHDVREAWRWDGYMDWARGQRDAAATAPLYPGAMVRWAGHEKPGRVVSYNPAGPGGQGSALIRFPALEEGGELVEQVLNRNEVTNLADHIRGDWTDAQLTAYGQRLLDRDPDAFFGIGQSEIGRESRGNLKRRILQDPRVNDLPTDLAQRVNDGQLSLPTAIEQAKTRPGWWAQYLENAPGLPEEIDDLLGLYRDPSQRYRTGAARAIHDQAVYKMHADLADRGMGILFFTEDTMVPGHYEKIGGKGPLAQLVTSPEIAAVIRGTENTSKQISPWLAGWRKLNGAVKLAKTAGNFPAGHIRNAAAWPFQLMAGGHFVAAFDPRAPIKLLPYQVADKLGSQRGAIARLGKRLADSVELADGTRLGERWSMKLDDLRPEIEHLYRVGVFGESSTAADLRHYAGAFPTLREPAPVAGARRVLKAPVEAGINFWAGGDDLGKHVYYRAELQNLAWAENMGTVPPDYFTRPEWEEIGKEAAERTRLTTPTSSMIAPGIKALRDAPLAPFPGWTAEVFRNANEQRKLALADLRSSNPRRKILGAKRLSGFLATAALAGGGMAAILNRWSGAKDPEGVRSFVPPWSRDSQLAVMDLDRSGGKVRYVDLSALIPQAAFADAAAGILRSVQDPTDSSWDASIDAMQSLVQPFLEEEIIANAALDWARNKQGGESALLRPFNMLREHERYDPGYPVYTEGAKFTTQLKQSIYHWWRALAPAGVAGLQGERLARAFWSDNPEVRKTFVELTNYDRELKVEDEKMAGLGLRVSTVDVKKSLSRLGTDYVRRRSEASSLYTRRSKMGADGRAHPEVILAAKAEANQMGRSVHDQTARIVADAIRLGYSQEQVRQWLKDGNIAKKHITALITDAQRLLQGHQPASYLPVVP